MSELEKQAADNAAMRIELASLTERQKAADDRHAESERVMTSLHERINTLSKENANLESALCASRDEQERLREELDEKEKIEEAVRDIEDRFKGFEKMKARYEKRIARLREEVVKLKKASGSGDPEADEIKEIDMLCPPPVSATARYKSCYNESSGRVVKDESDWLELL